MWITQGRSLTAPSWPCTMVAKITFSKHLHALQKTKGFYKVLYQRTSLLYFIESKSIYRISQLSKLFFFKRDLAPAFLLSERQRGRLPADHTLNGFMLGGYNLNPEKSELYFSLKGRLLRKSSVKIFMDARRILSLKHKGNIKFCCPLRMKPDLVLNIRCL